MSCFLVVNDHVQPIPFLTMDDALKELERIREKTTVVTWEIIYDDQLRERTSGGSSGRSSGRGSGGLSKGDMGLIGLLLFMFIMQKIGEGLSWLLGKLILIWDKVGAFYDKILSFFS